MIVRTITPKVLELLEKFPIVAITGSRQSGKTINQSFFKGLDYFKKLKMNGIIQVVDTVLMPKS